MSHTGSKNYLEGSGDPNLDDTIKDGGGNIPRIYVDKSTNPDTWYKFDGSLASGSKWVEVSSGGGSTGLEAINEGNGIGWRLIGRNPANYGNIGFGATDFSESNSASSTKGATGGYSVSYGLNNTASGLHSITYGSNNTSSGSYSLSFGDINVSSGTRSYAFGYNNNVSGANSLASGFSLIVSGQQSFSTGNSNSVLSLQSSAFGIQNTANSLACMVIGCNSTVATGQNLTSYVSTDEVFKIGNGTSTGSRSNALVIYKNAVQKQGGITAAALSAITPEDGMKAYVTDTNGTFTSIGFWGRENGVWNKL